MKILTATDCVKDRLASYYHWSDRQGLEQALMVACDQEIDLKAVEQWSEGEGHQEKFTIFSDRLHKLID